MDILTYDYLLNGLKEYNKEIEQNYGNVVVPFPTTNTTYPTTVFEEIRNVANQNYNSCYERLASVGYRADIYAKTKGSVTKQTIARKIAQQVDEYLTAIGLTRVSYNVSELENDSSIYHIIITYSGNLQENKRRFI
jgi:adenine-specific DNA methylase